MSKTPVFLRSCFDRLRTYLGKGAVPETPPQPAQANVISATAARINAEFEKALALHQAGKLGEAEAIYMTILQQQFDHVDVLHNLGVVQAQRQNFAAAVEWIVRAMEVDPDNKAAHLTLGGVYTALNRNEEAVATYDRALVIDPDQAEALNHRGTALFRCRQYEQAVASYDRALSIGPEYADAHYNRGIALAFLRRYREALASYDRAIAFNPEYADAWNNRGVVLAELNRHIEALASYGRALMIRPDYPDALNNRGGLCMRAGLYDRAAQDFSQLIELDSNFENALGNKLHSNLYVCNWRNYIAEREQLCRYVREGKRVAQPFAYVVMSDNGADHLTCARTFVAHSCPLAARALWTGEHYQHDRIRLAYLSADFHHHATAYLMAELFEKHDRSRFEVSAWSFGPAVEDDMRARLRSSFEQFNDVREMADIDVAAKLRAQEIDIAVDLKGFTQGSRTIIFAHRAVPVQINYLGYPGTMGSDYIDYIIGDVNVIPPEHEAFYAEKVVRLPDTYQVNDSKRAISERTPSRAEANLPESGFVFCCFNNTYKIVPEVFDIWMQLLARVEGSVLWLLNDNAVASRNLRLAAETRGVRADRLIFAPRMPLPEHLARHRLADLFLDTLPCNAHTTASDALWAGLPILTCLGTAFPGRVAASLLRAVGLPELIVENLAAYEALALKLATMPTVLMDVKAKLARNRTTHPLFDIVRFGRHMESAYITMYERYQRGEPPQSFSVQPLP